MTAQRFFITIATALLLIIMAAPAWAAGQVTVESAQARIRSGPGNYFEVISVAAKGATLDVIELANNWYRIKLPQGGEGFVSAKSIGGGDRTASLRGFRPSEDMQGVGNVSRSEIMAATKGVSEMGPFARGYAARQGIDPSVLQSLMAPVFTPAEFRAFKGRIGVGPADPITGMDSRVSIPFEGKAMEAVDYEVGAAVAMKIVATSPLSPDRTLRAYVSMVGTALVEQTPYYDEPFVFLVIESPLVRSFSTPGGYVFITTGALAVMRDEAALAGVLAHEIVHVVERHGVKELGKQAQRIKSSTMMDSLDTEVDQLGMDTGDRRVAAELDAMTDEMYEHIIGGRKRADEDTSDRLGTMVIYNTGYTATGIADFLAAAARAGEAGGSSAYRSADERIGLINKLIKQKYMTHGSRRNNADRFAEFVRVR